MRFDETWWFADRIVSPIPLCGAIAVRHGWQKLPTLEQCWSLTQHRCKSQPFWPFRDPLKIQGDGHNGNNQHNRQHTHTHITISQKNAQKSKSKQDDVRSIFPDFFSIWFLSKFGIVLSVWACPDLLLPEDSWLLDLPFSRWRTTCKIGHFTCVSVTNDLTESWRTWYDRIFQGRKVDWSMWFCVLLVHWGWWQGDSDHLQLESSECVGESSRVLARIKWQYHFAESWRRRYAMGSGHDRQ